MAEFSEVMRQAQRMCDHRRKRGLTCIDCDAMHICGFKIWDVGLDTLCADADAVMAWAAEHPEPVYPTWGEWLMEQMVIAERMRPKYDYTNGKHTDELERTGEYIALDSEMKKQIPADIAEKLGIEPKK